MGDEGVTIKTISRRPETLISPQDGISELILDADPNELMEGAQLYVAEAGVSFSEMGLWMKMDSCPMSGKRMIKIDGCERLLIAVQENYSDHELGVESFLLAKQVILLLTQESLPFQLSLCIGIIFDLAENNGLKGYLLEDEYKLVELKEFVLKRANFEQVLNNQMLKEITLKLARVSDARDFVMEAISSGVTNRFEGVKCESVGVRLEVFSALLNYLESLVAEHIKNNRRDCIRYTKENVVIGIIAVYGLRQALKDEVLRRKLLS